MSSKKLCSQLKSVEDFATLIVELNVGRPIDIQLYKLLCTAKDYPILKISSLANCMDMCNKYFNNLYTVIRL